MTTVYSIHDARNAAILATATVENVQTVAASVARALSGPYGETRRAFVHNGLGIIAAGLCRQGSWHDVIRTDYLGMDADARAARERDGLPVYPA